MYRYVTRDRELHHRADLDGLRAIAILAVLGFHAFPGIVPGGFVGVDVFFVISGFLISALILGQLRRSTFTLVDFYIRRVRRLFPALAVVLAGCLLFGWFALLPEEFAGLGKHVGAAAAFVLNFSVWREGSYFDPAADLNPVLHLWSLGIEEQFYLVWPLALLLLWRHRRSLVCITGLLVAASFALNIVFLDVDPRGAFYLPVTRFWELGLGCLLAISQDRQSPAPGAGRSAVGFVLSVTGLALIGGAAFLFDERMRFPGWIALVPAAGASCIISAVSGNWLQRRVLGSAPLVFVGLISYPLYLWHWPLLSFAQILGAGTPPAMVRAAAVALSFLLAYVVFRWVELPIRARTPWRASGLLTAGLGALGAAGMIIYAGAGIGGRFGHDVRVLNTASRVNRYCLRTFSGRQDFNYCKSTSAAPPEVIFLGDSRTQAVYDGMVSITARRYPMMLLARGGCPPMLSVRAEAPDEHQASCNDTWDDFVKYVGELKPRVVVLVGGGAGESGTDDFRTGLSDLITALQRSSKVIYMRETPAFDTGPACFLRPVKVPWATCSPLVERQTMEQRLAIYNESVDDIESRLPGLVVVDSIDALCGSKYCAQKLRSGEILYRDPMHLTAAGARHLDRGSGLVAEIDAAIRR